MLLCFCCRSKFADSQRLNPSLITVYYLGWDKERISKLQPPPLIIPASNPGCGAGISRIWGICWLSKHDGGGQALQGVYDPGPAGSVGSRYTPHQGEVMLPISCLCCHSRSLTSALKHCLIIYTPSSTHIHILCLDKKNCYFYFLSKFRWCSSSHLTWLFLGEQGYESWVIRREVGIVLHNFLLDSDCKALLKSSKLMDKIANARHNTIVLQREREREREREGVREKNSNIVEKREQCINIEAYGKHKKPGICIAFAFSQDFVTEKGASMTYAISTPVLGECSCKR